MFYKMLKVTPATLHNFFCACPPSKNCCISLSFFQVYYLLFINWCHIHKCLSTGIYIPKYVSTVFSVYILLCIFV